MRRMGWLRELWRIVVWWRIEGERMLKEQWMRMVWRKGEWMREGS